MADDKFVMPKGRMTIRSGASSDKRNGRDNRRIRAWDFNPEPGSTIAKLETAFLGALTAVDAVIARRDVAMKCGKFTADGVSDDVLQFTLSDAVPVLKRGRNAIASAKPITAEALVTAPASLTGISK
jgi:hypothetical protein